MKLLSGLFISIFIFAACSPTERIAEPEPDETETPEEESAVPDWYSSDLYASSDSVAVYGYAMASAADSAAAAGYALRSVKQNLRFEIDRLAEDVRRELASRNGDTYSATTFIINLRNLIRDLPLDDAGITVEHEISENGIHYIYTRAELSRIDLISLLEQDFQDPGFLEKLGSP